MLSPLASRLARLERQRAEVLGSLHGLGPAQLRFRPAPDSWNLLDVIEHLVLIEERILGGLGTRPGPLPILERVRVGAGFALLTAWLRGGGRIRVPTRAILPGGSSSLDELRGRWDAARAGLSEALERFERSDLRRPMMRHPIVGKLSPAQTLSFIHTHVAHHRPQLARIRSAPGFPVAIAPLPPVA